MNAVIANAMRFLDRGKGKRTLAEREAYLEGLFDGGGTGLTSEEQAAVEKVLFKKGEGHGQ